MSKHGLRFHVHVYASASSRFDYVTHLFQTGLETEQLKERFVGQKLVIQPVRVGAKTMQSLKRVEV